MLRITNLTKKFGDVRAVDGLSLKAAKGETVVLMGPSGCGKSTTIRAVNRLIEPDAGSVRFDGVEITALDEASLRAMRKRIGYVFQHFQLIGRLSAVENVMLGLVMGGMERGEARRRALEALCKVGMERRAECRPGALSGGQQQRVGIARALAGAPELLLWDEPTASLDPILVRGVLEVMEELAKYRAATMLVVTHELSFALRVADRIVLMDKGRAVEEGKPSQVFFTPQSEIGRQYKELIEYQMRAGVQTLAGKSLAS